MINKQTIRKTLLKWPKKTIYLKELSRILGGGKSVAYEDFYSEVKVLVQAGLLTPIPGSGSNGMQPFLENRYRVNLHKLPGIHELKAELLKLHVKLKITYYQNHMDEYIKDREIVRIFNDYLFSGTFYKKIERRELAFLLFRDEKALDSTTKAYKVLNRLGLHLEKDFNCFDRRLPVTYFPFTKHVRKVLIVENLTPFYDLFLIFRKIRKDFESLGKDAAWRFKEHSQVFASQIPFDSLALGNGNHIVSAFEFFSDIFDQPTDVEYSYWGDMDGAGLNIYFSLKKKYSDFKINLWEKAYERMLQEGQWRKDQSGLSERPEIVSDPCLEQLIDVIKANKAIPQEILNFSILEELIHGE
ncbi:MAG: hypothetical protein ACOC34_03310 [Thermotogota bacterium]